MLSAVSSLLNRTSRHRHEVKRLGRVRTHFNDEDAFALPFSHVERMKVCSLGRSQARFTRGSGKTSTALTTSWTLLSGFEAIKINCRSEWLGTGRRGSVCDVLGSLDSGVTIKYH